MNPEISKVVREWAGDYFTIFNKETKELYPSLFNDLISRLNALNLVSREDIEETVKDVAGNFGIHEQVMRGKYVYKTLNRAEFFNRFLEKLKSKLGSVSENVANCQTKNALLDRNDSFPLSAISENTESKTRNDKLISVNELNTIIKEREKDLISKQQVLREIDDFIHRHREYIQPESWEEEIGIVTLPEFEELKSKIMGK